MLGYICQSVDCFVGLWPHNYTQDKSVQYGHNFELALVLNYYPGIYTQPSTEGFSKVLKTCCAGNLNSIPRCPKQTISYNECPEIVMDVLAI